MAGLNKALEANNKTDYPLVSLTKALLNRYFFGGCTIRVGRLSSH